MHNDATNTEGADALAAQLGECLRSKGLSIVTAESCTGGLLAGALTSVPGSSDWFLQGWVTYTNEAKMQQLAVDVSSLEQFGAVSKPVARQMAAGALATESGAQLAIATTGVAGPSGGTADKPVGLVWFGFAQRIEDILIVTAQERIFEGNRAQVREQAVEFALTHALALCAADSPASDDA